MAKDAHWIEHAHLNRGSYGHHSAAQIAKDSKKPGKLGKKARLAKTLGSLRKRGSQRLYGAK
jgi:hypothetical protein